MCPITYCYLFGYRAFSYISGRISLLSCLLLAFCRLHDTRAVWLKCCMHTRLERHVITRDTLLRDDGRREGEGKKYWFQRGLHPGITVPCWELQRKTPRPVYLPRAQLARLTIYIIIHASDEILNAFPSNQRLEQEKTFHVPHDDHNASCYG